MQWNAAVLKARAGKIWGAAKRGPSPVSFPQAVEMALNESAVPISDRASVRSEICSMAGRSGGKKSAQARMKKKAAQSASGSFNKMLRSLCPFLAQ